MFKSMRPMISPQILKMRSRYAKPKPPLRRNEKNRKEAKSKGPGKRGHIVADTNVSPFARASNICCVHKFCVQDTRNVSDFVQKFA